MDFRIQDRMELKALVDCYATESDKNNQDCYVEIFRPDVKLDVYFDKYVKIDGRWWIAEREQHFEWTSVPPLAQGEPR